VTVVLVTHFMEEAQRLCDRLAVIDAGRVVALDSPTGLVSKMDSENRLTFRPSRPVDEAELLALPEVREVRLDGSRLAVTGDSNVVQAVVSLLARNHIVAEELRVEQTNLDDAFVALTGHPAND
jgi:ABC-2 type transport system ATP-binding protein